MILVPGWWSAPDLFVGTVITTGATGARLLIPTGSPASPDNGVTVDYPPYERGRFSKGHSRSKSSRMLTIVQP